MKKITYILLLTLGLTSLNSCQNWLTILPENEQTSDKFWKNKEDVLSVLTAGYVKLRDAVPLLLDWGELRGGCMYNTKSTKLELFRVTPTDEKICSWASLYQTINMANSVITYAPQVMLIDETFEEPVMKSYLAEAYFLRALSYFYLVRNFKEVPLVLTPYVNDEASYEKAKSKEEVIITQIKADIRSALETKAAKEFFSVEWQTKGRATKWALYALMADVSLWSEDYENAIIYCNHILEGGANRPILIENSAEWFTIFYPGNSPESIFEVQWDMTVDENQKNPLCAKVGPNSPEYYYTPWMLEQWMNETDIVGEAATGRGLFGSYASNAQKNDGGEANEGYIWKYFGGGALAIDNARAKQDANFMVYRMADIYLMKAEALTLIGGREYWNQAIDLVNTIRHRTDLPDANIEEGDINEENVLDLILTERCMEFASEGKRWYDLLRFGKRNQYKYKEKFLIAKVAESTSGSPSWARSVLMDENAHYLPIWTKELIANPLLTQNPYYEIGK